MKIANENLAKAVRSLVLTDPFFAAMLLQQSFVEDNSSDNPTCAVDGVSFFYNSAFCNGLTFDELKGVVAHEAMHLVGGHHWRMGERDSADWNKATDYAINGLLTAKGFKLPSGVLIDSKFAGQSAEDIYRAIRLDKQGKKQGQNPQQNPSKGQQGAQQAQGQGQGQQSPQNGQNAPQNGAQDSDDDGEPSFGQVRKAPGKPAAQAEADNLAQIAKAQSIAKQFGVQSAGVLVEVNRAKEGSIDWRAILHRFFAEFTSADYSYSRLNKSYMQRGIVFPTLQSRSTGTVVLVCDTSGSTLGEMGRMVEEIQACMGQYLSDGVSRPLKVIYADSEVCGVEDLLPGDKPSPKGGGGTNFDPAFRWVEENGGLGEASALIYLTDGDAPAPTVSVDYPVLWCLVRDNRGFNPPFGEVVNVALVD